jgi:hypothetical protein
MQSHIRAALVSSFLAIAIPLVAQERLAPQEQTKPSSTSSAKAAQPDAPGTVDDQWHIRFLPYLWFAGMHGTTGVRGFNTSVSASAGDLLSHFNIGLMAATELRKNRFVVPVDMMWMRLSDDHGLPLNEVGVNSIDFRVGQFLLTPEVGYRFVDKPSLTVDAVAGLRYWHLGEKLTFSPTVFNGISTSENWVDAVGGSKIRMLLSPKTSIVIAGDAGGGGASPDYQVVGLLGFQVKETIRLQAGWRYLDVHYRNNSSLFLYDVAASGAVVGATINFK